MKIYTSPRNPVTMQDVPLHDYVLTHAAPWGDALAMMQLETGERMSFTQLVARARALSAELVARGWRKGEVLAYVAPNLIDFPVVMQGASGAGVTLTTANPGASDSELEWQLRDSGARAVVTSPGLLQRVQGLAQAAGITQVYTLGPAAPGSGANGADAAGDLRTWYTSRAPAAQVSIDTHRDIAVLPYSSGTSGRAKGVMLTHWNMVSMLEQAWGVHPPGTRGLAVLPFFHIFGMQVLANLSVCAGMETYVMAKFDFQGMLEAIQTHRIQVMSVVPPMVNGMVKSPLAAQYDLSSLTDVGCGAAPLDSALQEAFVRRTGAALQQGYGMTETSLAIASNGRSRADRKPPVVKPGSSGFLFSAVEARIVDVASGEDLGPGEDGEIRVRGPNIMFGYLNNPSANRSTFDEQGWLRTGDIGHFDDEGYLYITDRLKELIKVKGHQVAPARLEGVLKEHPQVVDCAVIGVPDEDKGEAPRAFVVRAPGSTLDADGLQEFLSTRLARYEAVRDVVFVPEIPKSPSGKLLRRLLREMVVPA